MSKLNDGLLKDLKIFICTDGIHKADSLKECLKENYLSRIDVIYYGLYDHVDYWVRKHKALLRSDCHIERFIRLWKLCYPKLIQSYYFYHCKAATKFF